MNLFSREVVAWRIWGSLNSELYVNTLYPGIIQLERKKDLIGSFNGKILNEL